MEVEFPLDLPPPRLGQHSGHRLRARGAGLSDASAVSQPRSGRSPPRCPANACPVLLTLGSSGAAGWQCEAAELVPVDVAGAMRIFFSDPADGMGLQA